MFQTRNNMNLDIVVQLLLAVHTLVLYPIFRFAYLMEKRLTKLEVTNEIKCDVKCAK